MIGQFFAGLFPSGMKWYAGTGVAGLTAEGGVGDLVARLEVEGHSGLPVTRPEAGSVSALAITRSLRHWRRNFGIADEPDIARRVGVLLCGLGVPLIAILLNIANID
jgi:hypothetical protein